MSSSCLNLNIHGAFVQFFCVQPTNYTQKTITQTYSQILVTFCIPSWNSPTSQIILLPCICAVKPYGFKQMFKSCVNFCGTIQKTYTTFIYSPCFIQYTSAQFPICLLFLEFHFFQNTQSQLHRTFFLKNGNTQSFKANASLLWTDGSFLLMMGYFIIQMFVYPFFC